MAMKVHKIAATAEELSTKEVERCSRKVGEDKKVCFGSGVGRLRLGREQDWKC